MRNLLLPILLLISTEALALGWSSGGGELFLDASNPWFVRNTKSVSYCVRIDEANFGISEDRAAELVTSSFAYWTRFFATSSIWQNWGVAHQTFHRVNCNSLANADVTFLFGTLDPLLPQERKQLSTPERRIGIAVRTDYDLSTMRGRGFIYLSPQEGKLALKHGIGKIDRPWSYENGALVNLVLTHELGHVFGYRHDSTLFPMGERFTDDLLDPIYARAYAPISRALESGKVSELSSTLMDNCFEESEVQNVPENRSLLAFYGVREGSRCIRVVQAGNSLRVFSRVQPESAWVLTGTGLVEASTRKELAGPTIYIPPEQSALPREKQVFGDIRNSRYLTLPGGVIESATVRYQTVDRHVQRDLALVKSPLESHLSGFWNGISIPDALNASSFSLFTTVPGSSEKDRR